VLLVITIGVSVVMNLPQAGTASSDELTRSYDSPVGLLAGMQATDVKSGKFKLRADYVGDGSFERSGVFAVKEGELRFTMIEDEKRVNELLKLLYDRQGKKTAFDAAGHGVTK